MSKAPQIDEFIARWKYTGASEHARLEEFWSELTESSHYHVQDLTGTNAVFGGDFFLLTTDFIFRRVSFIPLTSKAIAKWCENYDLCPVSQ